MRTYGHVLALAAARARHRWLESLLTAVATAIAVGLLTTGTVSSSSVESSFAAAAAARGAPQLLVAASSGADAATVRGVAGVHRVGSWLDTSDGVATGAKESLPVEFVVATPETAPWLAVTSGTSKDLSRRALVEAGLAERLGTRPGGSLTLAGPGGAVSATVAGVVSDLSRARYPLHSPGVVYIGSELAASLDVHAAAREILPVWAAEDDLAGTASAIAAALAGSGGVVSGLGVSGVSVSALRNSVDSLALLTALTTGSALLFGIIALLAVAAYLASSTRLRVIRDEADLGQLAATGWPVRDLRLLLVVERGWFVLAGALAGVALGWWAASWVTARLAEQFGAGPSLGGVAVWAVASVAAVLVVLGLATVASTRLLRHRAPIQLIRREFGSQRHRTPVDAVRREIDARRHPPEPAQLVLQGSGTRHRRPAEGRVLAPWDLGLRFVQARPSRSLVAAGSVVIAVATAVFGLGAASTLDRAVGTPRVWGITYDHRLDLASAAALSTLPEKVAALPGVTIAEPLVEGRVAVGAARLSATMSVLPLRQRVFTPGVLSGRLPRSSDEVAVSRSLAETEKLRVGGPVALASSAGSRTATVSGVVREVAGSGGLVLAGPAFTGLVVDPRYAVLVAGSATGAALSAAAGPDVAVTSASEAIALPFADTLRTILTALLVALTVLALVVAVSAATATSAEHLRDVGLLLGLGATRDDLRRVSGGYALGIVAPSLPVGALTGALATHWGIGVATSGLGGIPVTIPIGPVMGLVVGVGALLTLAYVVPMFLAARRTPVTTLRGLAWS